MTPLLAVFLAMVVSDPAPGMDLGDGLVRLRGEVFSAVAGPASAPELLRPGPLAPDEVGAWLVAFEGPADVWIRGVIEEEGRRIVGYVPSCAYLVRATRESVGRLAGRDGIVRVERYRPAWKISPEIGAHEFRDPSRRALGDRLLLNVSVFAGERPEAVAEAAREAGMDLVYVRRSPERSRVVVVAERSQLPELAAVSAVEWIEEVGEIELRNDDVRWIVQSNTVASTPLHDRGLGSPRLEHE